MGDYHTIGAQRDRARTWSYLERIAAALEQIAGQQLADDGLIALLDRVQSQLGTDGHLELANEVSDWAARLVKER